MQKTVEKNRIRATIKEERRGLDKVVKQELDRRLTKNFICSALYKDACGLMAYHSLPDEPDTRILLQRALRDGKRIALPVIQGDIIIFYEVTDLSGLKRGCLGVMEPDVSHCRRADPHDYKVCVVPGLCFDKQGMRLGYGKGYYDRFLAGYSGVAAGFTYDRFILDDVSAQPHDRGVDVIFTESGVQSVGYKKN